MLSRPKPGESEVDLLRFQSQFLEAGAAPAVQLVKGSRRHGDAHPDQLPPQDRRDVVMLDSECLQDGHGERGISLREPAFLLRREGSTYGSPFFS